MAEHRLTDRLAGIFPPTRRAEKFVALALLFALLMAAIVCITDTFWGPDFASLWHSVFFGLLIGWTLAVFKQPLLRAILIVLTIGLFYILLFPGGLSGEFVRLLSNMMTAWKGGTVDLKSLMHLFQELSASTGIILERIRAWMAALAVNQSAFDPLAVGIVWNALVWCIAAWAGWVVEARRNALLAAFPAVMLSVGTLAYGQRISLVLYLMLGMTLLLLATLQHDRRKQGWDELGVAYPARKGRQIANAALVATIALVFLSAFLSSISFHRIREWVSGKRPATGQDNRAAQSISGGTVSSETFRAVHGPGLQRDHIIGSGPGLSERVVMTVSVGNLSSISRGGQLPPLYWRGATYDVYTGHGWSTSNTELDLVQADQPLQVDRTPGLILVEQDVHPVEDLAGTVYAAGEPVTLNRSSEAAWRSPGDLFGVRTDGSVPYKVFSLIPVVNKHTLQAAGQKYPDWVRQRFLDLPPGVPERVKALAMQLTASRPTPYDQALAIESYLRTFPYALDVPLPPSQQDVVDYFLFDLKKGYCDYYASAMAVLARAAGIPARLVVGYASGTYNLNSRRFVVTEADAHSWVEVFFPGIGWVPFEPTAASPRLERSEALAQDGTQNSNPSGQTSGARQPNFLSWGWLLLPGALALAGMAGTAWAISDEFRLHHLPQQSAAAEIYRRMRRCGSRLAVTTDPGATPYEFAASLSSRLQILSAQGKRASPGSHLIEAVQRLVDGIVWVSYRPASPQNMHILRQWNELRWRLNLMWMLKTWKVIQDYLKGMLAGIPRKARIEE